MANIDSDNDVQPGKIDFKFVPQVPPSTHESLNLDTGQSQYAAAAESLLDDPLENPRSSHPSTRVARACDECRRRKIKCDSQLPCTHCRSHFFGESIQNLMQASDDSRKEIC